MKLVLCIALLASPFVVEGMTLRHGSNQGMTLPRSMTYEEWKHFCHHGNDFCGRGFSLDHLLAHLGGHSQPVVSLVTTSGHHMVQHSQPVVHSGFSPSYHAAARNMPVELFSSDVGALDFSGPALDSGAVDGRYWFFSQAAPVLTTHKKRKEKQRKPKKEKPAGKAKKEKPAGKAKKEKPAGKDIKKKTEKTEKKTQSLKYPKSKYQISEKRSEGNIVSPVGGHPIVTSNNQQSVPEGRWEHPIHAQQVVFHPAPTTQQVVYHHAPTTQQVVYHHAPSIHAPMDPHNIRPYHASSDPHNMPSIQAPMVATMVETMVDGKPMVDTIWTLKPRT